MIELKDLRKGNFVNYKNEIFQIKSIDTAGEKTDIEFTCPSKNEGFEPFIPRFKELNFIPLNKEILTVIGFNFFIDKKGDIFFTHANLERFCILESNGIFSSVVGPRINYVHELQNFFFVKNEREMETNKLNIFFDIIILQNGKN